MKSASDSSVWVIERHNKTPKKRLIGLALIDPVTSEPENPLWLQIESIDDGFGNFVDTITVNQTLKDSIQAQDIIDDQKKSDDLALDDATVDALLTKLIAFDEANVKGIADIKDFMKDIKNYLLFKYKDKVKVKKKKGK